MEDDQLSSKIDSMRILLNVYSGNFSKVYMFCK